MRAFKYIMAACVALVASTSVAGAAELSTNAVGFELTLSHNEVEELANGVESIQDIVIFDDPAIGVALEAEVQLMRLADWGWGVHIDGSWLSGPAHIIRPVGAPSAPPSSSPPPGHHPEGLDKPDHCR